MLQLIVPIVSMLDHLCQQFPMDTLICRNPINLCFRSSSSLTYLPSISDKNCKFILLSSRKYTPGLKSLGFCSLRPSYARSSTAYGGWDDVAIVEGSDGSGELDTFRSFLVSVGVYDGKNIFVFLVGLVCAMAITRVKVSSIVLLPASVLVFAVGFTVGFFRNGNFSDLKVNGSKKKSKEEIFKLFDEKLRNLVEFFDELDLKVNNLKNNMQTAIRNNEIKVSDLDGYVGIADSIKLSALNARNIVRILIDNEENSSSVTAEHNKTVRRKKEFGETEHQMLQSLGNLFGENLARSNSTKVRENVKQQTPEKPFEQTRGNSSTSPVEDRALNPVNDSRATGNLGSLDSSSNSMLDLDGNGRIKSNFENEIFGSGNRSRRSKKYLNEEEYVYGNNRLRFTNNQSFSSKMGSNRNMDTWESQNNLVDSENFNVRFEHMESESSFVREQMFNRAHETYRSSHDKSENESYRSHFGEDRVDYNNQDLANDFSGQENESKFSSSAKISDDIVFDRYLAEATDLLKQAKDRLKGRHDEEQAEILLYKSANLLSKAVDLKPMSLLAVGQLGNTYLLHGELKLKISRQLRTLLSRGITSSSGRYSRILMGLRNKIASTEEVEPLLVDVCEECEELLVEAGRKYRLALSIDGNDVRALYNWGLALSFRGQLIADIGPSAAFEADKVFLAAIDKFDAIMSKGNVYTPDALFGWGTALQQRSRLRPASSKEKLKLLQQAKRLYEDALHMDSDNIQVKDALSSCISELHYRRF